MNERASNRRIRLLLGLFALVFAGTLGRAIWLQGVQASTLERIAARQHEQTTEIPAGRGTIYDRTGEPLAIGEQATTVYADPRLVQEPAAGRARRRAKSLGARRGNALPAARRPDAALRLRGAEGRSGEGGRAREAEAGRARLLRRGAALLPAAGVAAHVLGFAGVDNDGLEGLERSLDKQLIGKPGSQTTVTDPAGRVDRRRSRRSRSRPVTTSSSRSTTASRRTPSRCCARPSSDWGAKAGNAIVLDPRTGAVLAMAVAPGYDANRFSLRLRRTGDATAPSPTSTSPARRSRS